MKLSQLLDQSLASDVEITGLSNDSRTVKPGDLFFAYKGANFDGTMFVEDAIAKGAHAIAVDSATTQWRSNIPIIPIPHLHSMMGKIAARFFDYPSKKLKVIGITGTNGKTSCSHFIATALHHLHVSCGIIGTLGNGLYNHIKPGSLTTPDALTLHSLLADFVKEGATTVSMEVSSHSLDQERVCGIGFAVGVFTNLTRDHLDYHGSMEKYFAAKRKLFDTELTEYAVINLDDAFGRQLIKTLPNKKIFAYSAKGATTATVYAHQVQLNLSGMKIEVVTPWGRGEISVPLIGEFNVSNILAVLATLCLLDIPLKAALTSLQKLTSVAGRMQMLGGKNQPLVVVDYAHTPDALEKVLIALRSHCQGKLYCLFGCGGDRDRGKRPLMAHIAEQYADRVIVTDDNPRTESPKQIIADILLGFKDPKKIIVQHDRSKAIQDIIQCAQIHDCILVAGKGAETYQQIGHDKIPFSDVEKVMENLNSCSFGSVNG